MTSLGTAPWLRYAFIALAIGSGVLPPARARAQGAAAVALSLKAAQQRSQAQAPAVLVAAARADAVRTEGAVAAMLPNPRLTVGTTSGNAQLYGNLYVALPLFGQLKTARGAADAQARVATAGVEVARLDARLAATTAWVTLWQVEAEQRVAEENAARRERLLDVAAERYAEGAAPRLDVLRAETEARRARVEVLALGEQHAAALAELRVLLGAPANERMQLAGEPELLEIPPAPASLESLVAAHPLTRRARALLQVAGAVIAREQRARWPVLGLQLGGSFFERQPPPGQDLSIGLTVELPVFNRPLIARAESAQRSAETEFRTVVMLLQASSESARATYLAARRRQEAQLDEVLPAAREAAELSLEAYDSGALDLTSVLAAEQALSDARLAAARLTADRARAAAALEHSLGKAL